MPLRPRLRRAPALDLAPHRRTARLLVLTVFALVVCAPALAAPGAAAEGRTAARDAEPTPTGAPLVDDGPGYPITTFEVEYAEGTPTDGLPPADTLLPATLELGETGSGYVAPREGIASATVPLREASAARIFRASAVAAVTRAVLERIQQLGVVGVFVSPSPADIDLRDERDLRPPGHRWLRLVVRVGRVKQIRTLAVGDRIADDWKINNPAHRAIRRNSPIQPAEVAREGQSDLLRQDLLADYLYRLNRYPGRRVEAALAASDDADGIALDLHVHEARPWFVFFQSSDTGSERTDKWQNSIGAVHRQLTGRDDTASIQYTNAGGDAVHALRASYEAPWFGRERPGWWKSQPDESFWKQWLHRDLLPWWGSDRLRWRLEGAYSRFKANDIALAEFDQTVTGSEWNLQGRLIYQAFQFHDLFVDLFTGLHLRNVQTRNEVLAQDAQATFLLPEVGLEVERVSEWSTLRASLAFEANVQGNDGEVRLLGRANTDERWKLLHFDVGASAFLEPLLFPHSWKDPTSERTSTLAHELAAGLRGQYAFGARLVPQASQVVGGLFSVRGYPQSTSVGDDAWVASAEYRFHLPRFLPVKREPLKVPGIGRFRVAPQQVYGRPDWDLILRGFIDYGRTRRNDRALATTRETNETLVGVGAGIEFQYRSNLVARIDWGRALRDSKEDFDGNPLTNDPVVRKGHDEIHLLFSVLY